MVRRILDEEVETPDFQAGAVAGYHAAANDLTTREAQDDEDLERLMCCADTEAHSEDYYAGWVGGYRVRRDLV